MDSTFFEFLIHLYIIRLIVSGLKNADCNHIFTSSIQFWGICSAWWHGSTFFRAESKIVLLRNILISQNALMLKYNLVLLPTYQHIYTKLFQRTMIYLCIDYWCLLWVFQVPKEYLKIKMCIPSNNKVSFIVGAYLTCLILLLCSVVYIQVTKPRK